VAVRQLDRSYRGIEAQEHAARNDKVVKAHVVTIVPEIPGFQSGAQIHRHESDAALFERTGKPRGETIETMRLIMKDGKIYKNTLRSLADAVDSGALRRTLQRRHGENIMAVSR
jgi:hypothetical protein